jgi:propionate catabolism operon transcriptional regulator
VTPERERDRILAVLDRYQGNRRAAARALGIDRSTLWRKVRQLTPGIDGASLPGAAEGAI